MACRAALLRLYHLQLLSKAPAKSATLQKSLEQLVEVSHSLLLSIHIHVLLYELSCPSALFQFQQQAIVFLTLLL